MPVFKYTKGSSTTQYIVSSIQANTLPTATSNNPFRTSTSTSSAVTVTDDPQGVSDTWRYEYESMGTMDNNGNWIFSKPALHNYKATNGTNGDPGTKEFCMYKAGTRSSDYSFSGQKSVYDLVQLDWEIDYNSVTTDSDNPVIWAVSTDIPVNEANPTSSNTTNRTWSDPRVVFEKGEKGASIAGPAVRGPVRWEDAASGREWLSGKGESGFTDSDKWIDIVTRVYVPGRSGSEYWDNANAQYKFVATEVLLANSAKINVLSNNALLLMDNQDEVVGGARGGDSADDVIFWAGTEESNMTALESAIPDAPFRVTFDGSLTSTKGYIGGWEIGANKLSTSDYSATLEITGTGPLPYMSSVTVSSNLVLGGLGLSGSASYTSSGQGTGNHYFDLNATKFYIWQDENSNRLRKIDDTGYTLTTITQQSQYEASLTSDSLEFLCYSSGGIRSKIGPDIISIGSHRVAGHDIGKFVADYEGNIYVAGHAYLDTVRIDNSEDKTWVLSNTSAVGITNRHRFVTTPTSFLGGLKLVIVTDDSSLFTKSNGKWYFNGAELGVSTSDYPYGPFQYGTWVLSTTNSTSGTTYDTGVLYTTSSLYTSSRRGDIIYIEI